MLDIDKGSKVTRPDFPKKSRVGRKSVKTGENWGLKKKKKKTALTILIKSCMKIEEIDTEQQKKTAHQNFHRFAGKSRKTGENIGFSGFSRKLQ